LGDTHADDAPTSSSTRPRPASWQLVICVVAAVLPWPARRFLYRQLLGYEIAPGARVGHSLVLCDAVRLDEGAVIGHGCVIRGCERLDLGADAAIGNLNWINGARRDGAYFAGVERARTVRLGRGAAITASHFIDCTDAVEIGDLSTLAGFRSQILTHSIDIASARQLAAPVKIGERCFVGSGAILLAGTTISDCVVVGAGTVVSRDLDEPFHVYAGAPVTKLRALSPDDRYFTRTEGPVL